MTDYPDDTAKAADAAPETADRTIAIIRSHVRVDTTHKFLEWMFLCWAWEAGYHQWGDGLRGLARGLRGLERTGLIERRTVRRRGEPTIHAVTLTEAGHALLAKLSGDTAEEDR